MQLAEERKRPWLPANATEWTAVALMLAGILAYLVMLIMEDGRTIWPDLIDALTNGDITRYEDWMLVSSFLTLSALVIATPFLFVWLRLSKLLRSLLRILAAGSAGAMWWFALQYGEYVGILFALAISPTLTFIGLCFLRSNSRKAGEGAESVFDNRPPAP